MGPSREQVFNDLKEINHDKPSLEDCLSVSDDFREEL